MLGIKMVIITMRISNMVVFDWSLSIGFVVGKYSGPSLGSILGPSVGPRKCGLILEVVLK